MNALKIVVPSVILACCAGCFSSHMAWVEGWTPDIPEELNANYRFVGESAMEMDIATRLNSVKHPQGERVDLSVFVRHGTPQPANGLLAKVNNIFSFFTIGIWPWVRSQETDCTVELVALGVKEERDYVLGHRVWSSFILPIGVLPCPGWADWRRCATLKLDFQQGPKQERWEAEMAAGYAGELLTPEFLQKIKDKHTTLNK